MLPTPRILNSLRTGALAALILLAGIMERDTGSSARGQGPAPVVRARFGNPGGVSPQSTPTATEQGAPALQPPRPAEIAQAPLAYAGLDESQLMPITLSAALRLAGTSNLDIAQSREVVRRAGIQLQRARIMLLPNVNLGSTYVDHDGQIQRAQGDVFTANRRSLFVGLGPSASVHLGDAIFAPLVARQVERASDAGMKRVHNETLQAIAEAYFTLMRSQRRLARAELTLDMLTSQNPAEIRSGSKGLLPLIISMQKAGAAEALKAEVNRVEVDVMRRREERVSALQEYRVASAELARQLRLPSETAFWPMEDFRTPMDVSSPWLDQPVEEIARIALANRPELAENQAQVQAAVERIRAARYRPLIPNLVVNYNFGGFGGGPSPNPIAVIRDGKSIVSGSPALIGNFDTRADFDITLMWRLQNLGLGNRAEIREQESFERQASLRQLQLQDLVVTQVLQTQEQIWASKERLAQIRAALYDSSGKPAGPLFEAMRMNFQRIREVEKTRPLEVLDSLRGLADFLELHAQAATDYERARFRLMIVLGLPPDEIITRVSVPLFGAEPKTK